MSAASAVAFLDRVEGDEAFAKQLEALKEDPAAVLAAVHSAGFDATAEELKAAYLERHGSSLTPEQLDAIAAGYGEADPAVIGLAVVGGIIGLATVATVAALV